ncbi:MAG: aldehyde dehydrogenase family protein [Aliidiomarina sp.]|uniref:aldehyde dehydrogenase family protein n=1 Tax=Aliidiomarina sp. TaxID=1872439 RepID=UPI0025BD6E8D|nr:aldehyde dehydrogenase family protein [Aliidiomarina sp.]MCH8501195.1 aldehyde dehydrogenase family protein [Aliidiomarina sp.]
MIEHAPKGLDPLLDQAIEAIIRRSSFSGFTETGSSRVHGEEKVAQGRRDYEALLGQQFKIAREAHFEHAERFHEGEEISPYTGERLGIQYPIFNLDEQYRNAHAAMRSWVNAGAEKRTEVCVQLLKDLDAQAFLIANAVMHTAGQSFPMAFAGSGANALDRGLEALAWAWGSLNVLPSEASWTKTFGGKHQVTLEKKWRIMPMGTAVVFCCASFPTWNGYPAIFANLACGNPVFVKPHPTAILPMAIAVKVLREGLRNVGFDPELVQLVVDSTDEPLGKVLVEHPETAIVDFTGSAKFGAWVEQHSGNRPCYTETSGVNSVILDSARDLDAVLDAITNTFCLFSAQMCTSPQTFYIPESGVSLADGRQVSADEIESLFCERIDQLIQDSKRASSVLGCIQSPATLQLLDDWQRRAESGEFRLLRASKPYTNVAGDHCRTATPLLLGLNAETPITEEVFAPIGFIYRVRDRDHALEHASAISKKHGALTTYLYSIDEEFIAKAEESFAWAGVALTTNLTGVMPLNFSAAYSDMHVSGLNPAGNATLAEPSFIAGRFRYAQSRRPKGDQ